jgi:hypothetical protein
MILDMAHYSRKPPAHHGLSRRQLLRIGGMTALGGSIACLGSILGYLALDELTDARRPTPTPPPARPTHLKLIDRPPITPRTEWGARAPDHEARNETGFYQDGQAEGWLEYEGDLRAIYRTVVVHHSVIYEIDDPATMRAIQDEHMDERGWADIGYHFGVGKNGQVFEGRALNARGTHVEGYNSGSVGVVFFGNFEEESPEPGQLTAGLRLINWLALRLELTHLAGHGDFNDFTRCPGRNMAAYMPLLAESALLSLGTDGYRPLPTASPTPES